MGRVRADVPGPDQGSVVAPATKEPTSVVGQAAFAAGGLAGAGARLAAGTPGWELVNNLSAIVGLALVTLSLAYILQVVNAVSRERTVASHVAGLGSMPVDAVAATASTRELGTLPLQLASVADSFPRVAQDHLRLPVVQFFHSPDRASSTSVNVARFDEILFILDHAFPGRHKPTVRAGRDAVDNFIGTLHLRWPRPINADSRGGVPAVSSVLSLVVTLAAVSTVLLAMRNAISSLEMPRVIRSLIRPCSHGHEPPA